MMYRDQDTHPTPSESREKPRSGVYLRINTDRRTAEAEFWVTKRTRELTFLAPREFDILVILAQHQGRQLPLSELTGRLVRERGYHDRVAHYAQLTDHLINQIETSGGYYSPGKALVLKRDLRSNTYELTAGVGVEFIDQLILNEHETLLLANTIDSRQGSPVIFGAEQKRIQYTIPDALHEEVEKRKQARRTSVPSETPREQLPSMSHIVRKVQAFLTADEERRRMILRNSDEFTKIVLEELQRQNQEDLKGRVVQFLQTPPTILSERYKGIPDSITSEYRV